LSPQATFESCIICIAFSKAYSVFLLGNVIPYTFIHTSCINHIISVVSFYRKVIQIQMLPREQYSPSHYRRLSWYFESEEDCSTYFLAQLRSVQRHSYSRCPQIGGRYLFLFLINQTFSWRNRLRISQDLPKEQALWYIRSVGNIYSLTI